MTIETPLSGKPVAATIVRDDHPPLCVTLGAAGLVRYALAPMLAAGWRIVEATPAERAVGGQRHHARRDVIRSLDP